MKDLQNYQHMASLAGYTEEIIPTPGLYLLLEDNTPILLEDNTNILLEG